MKMRVCMRVCVCMCALASECVGVCHLVSVEGVRVRVYVHVWVGVGRCARVMEDERMY